MTPSKRLCRGHNDDGLFCRCKGPFSAHCHACRPPSSSCSSTCTTYIRLHSRRRTYQCCKNMLHLAQVSPKDNGKIIRWLQRCSGTAFADVSHCGACWHGVLPNRLMLRLGRCGWMVGWGRQTFTKVYLLSEVKAQHGSSHLHVCTCLLNVKVLGVLYQHHINAAYVAYKTAVHSLCQSVSQSVCCL